jgi:hypothetical protein
MGMNAQPRQSASSLSTSIAAARQPEEATLERPAIGLLANEWAVAALILVITRGVALLGAYIGTNEIIALEPQRNKGWLMELGLMWDAGWYATLAKDGYHWYPEAIGGTNVAFPPLYPLLIRGFSEFLRWITFGWDWGHSTYGSLVVAGLIISNVSFLVALALFIRLLTPRLGRAGAVMVALALASLPLAFFFSAIYTEALFLLLVVAAFLVTRSENRHKWAMAGGIGLLASMLKFAGILLLPVLAVEYLSQKGWRLSKLRAEVLWLALVPAGLGLYMAYLWAQFGSPFVFLDSEYKGWGHETSFFATTYYEALEDLWKSLTHAVPPWADWVLLHGSGSRLWAFLDVLMPWFLLAGAFAARKKLFASEWTWLLLGIIFPLSSGTYNSLARYMLPLWPGLVWIGMVKGRSRWVVGILMVISLGLMGYCSYIYGSAKWIG